MALDPTLSEECFRKSIKKFFVDSLYTLQGLLVEFDTVYKIPKKNGVEVDQWVVFHFDGLSSQGCVSTGKVSAYLFSRRDSGGSNLSRLRDKIFDLLIDETKTNGASTIPYYDSSFNVVGGMIPSIQFDSEQDTGKDQTHFKYLNLEFSFGSK